MLKLKKCTCFQTAKKLTNCVISFLFLPETPLSIQVGYYLSRQLDIVPHNLLVTGQSGNGSDPAKKIGD